MTYARYCRQCGNLFQAHRADAVFCSGKCTAKFYRDNPNPEYIHAEKERIHYFVCDECGQGYEVNDYAKRGGKRAPRFCSRRCKQAAYRERVQQQAARRGEQSSTKSESSKNGSGQGHHSAHGQSEDTHSQNRKTRQSRGEKRDPYKILEVERTATKQAIRAAWKRLISKWHPDRNADNADEATRMSQDINWAYDVIGR